MESLKNLLSKQAQGTRRILSAAVIIATAENALAELFGAGAAGGMRVVSFYLGTLKISCDRPVVSQEAAIREGEIRAAVNRHLGNETVKRIVVC